MGRGSGEGVCVHKKNLWVFLLLLFGCGVVFVVFFFFVFVFFGGGGGAVCLLFLKKNLSGIGICSPSRWPCGNTSTLRAGDPGIDPRFARSGHISGLQSGTVVASLPGVWRYRVSAGTGWSGVSILGEMASLICNFCLSGDDWLSRSVYDMHSACFCDV